MKEDNTKSVITRPSSGYRLGYLERAIERVKMNPDPTKSTRVPYVKKGGRC